MIDERGKEKMAVTEVLIVVTCFASLFYLEHSMAQGHDNALNIPQVLLPYIPKESKPTTFTLKAGKGCFKW